VGQTEYVNIRIHKDTWQRMQPHKDEPGKTWDDVINELMDEVERLERVNKGGGQRSNDGVS